LVTPLLHATDIVRYISLYVKLVIVRRGDSLQMLVTL